MDWELLILVALVAAIIFAVKERIKGHHREQRKRKPAKPKVPEMSEEEIQARIENMDPEQEREVELQRMHYKIAPEWYLLDPRLQNALLNELAPRTVVKNGKATTEAQAALFIESLRAHPRTAKIEHRLTHRSARSPGNKNEGTFNKDDGMGHRK